MDLTRTAAALAAALLASTAAAQTPAGFQLQTYEPTPSGDLLFVAPDAGVAERGPSATLLFSFAFAPLVLRVDGQPVDGGRIVHRQFWGWVGASLPLFDRVLIDVSAPMAVYQSGSQPYPDLAPVTATAFGDVRVGARTPLVKREGWALSAAADLWFPTGSVSAFASDAASRVEGKLVASGEGGPVIWGASLGYLYRPELDVGFAQVGSAVTFTAGGAWRLGEFRVGPEIYGRLATAGSTSPVEGLLGGHWSRGAWDAGLALGTGFDQDPGAAPLRIVTQVTWQPYREEAEAGAARAATEAKAAQEKAAADRAEAERAAARAEAERLAAEQAAAVAAKAAADQAEAERISRENADRDGDGIPDRLDACPDVKGVPSTDPAKHGCPEESKLVKVTKERIEILQAIQFETAKDVIRKESEPILQEVAAILRGHPEITLVRVEGHTDNTGGAELNTRLSEQRARAVQRWLVERGGVEAQRLTAQGLGPSKPIADNATQDGRARNRRVEFNLAP
jgi:outer membrane protein OmpA-like peptidoglycan-associated protein